MNEQTKPKCLTLYIFPNNLTFLFGNIGYSSCPQNKIGIGGYEGETRTKQKANRSNLEILFFKSSIHWSVPALSKFGFGLYKTTRSWR